MVKRYARRLNAVEMNVLRRSGRVSRLAQLRNDEIRKRMSKHVNKKARNQRPVEKRYLMFILHQVL